MGGFRTLAKAAGVVAHLRMTHHAYQGIGYSTYVNRSSEPISADPANFLAINLRFLLFLLTRGKMSKVVEISCCTHVLTYEVRKGDLVGEETSQLSFACRTNAT